MVFYEGRYVGHVAGFVRHGPGLAGSYDSAVYQGTDGGAWSVIVAGPLSPPRYLPRRVVIVCPD